MLWEKFYSALSAAQTLQVGTSGAAIRLNARGERILNYLRARRRRSHRPAAARMGE